MAPRPALPARYPPVGTWPALMRADLTAAYLDYRDTGELARAVGRGEAPLPFAYRGVGRARQPIWSKADIDSFAARTPKMDQVTSEQLISLV